MSKKITLDVGRRHVEKAFPSDWMVVEANGEVVVVHEPGEMSTTVYTFGEPTRNPRVMANSDAVMWEGNIGKAYYEDKYLTIQHTFAGELESLFIEDLVDEPVPTLERTTLVDVEAREP